MTGIYANLKGERVPQVLRALTAALDEHGIDFAMLDRKQRALPDLTVVVGGDGTVLDIAAAAAAAGTTVLALNAGGTGFLSAFEADEIDECADAIANGRFDTVERPLISCRYSDEEWFALNEVTVQRTSTDISEGCTLQVTLSIGGEFSDRFRADGIIISTPTGSTAYSLSAGGAILVPGLGALIATPLCAHTLRSKPIVFSDTTPAAITVGGGGGIFIDGRFVSSAAAGAEILVCKSDLALKLVKGKKSFYSTLYGKLTSWSEK